MNLELPLNGEAQGSHEPFLHVESRSQSRGEGRLHRQGGEGPDLLLLVRIFDYCMICLSLFAFGADYVV